MVHTFLNEMFALISIGLLRTGSWMGVGGSGMPKAGVAGE